MKRQLFILLIAICSLPVISQHTNILIGTANSPNEPSIIINPKNTDELYAGSNIDNYYYSIDGGFTWTEGILYSAQNGVWGDPVMLCDTSGAFYFFHLSNPPDGNWIDRIVCQKALGPGQAWNDGTYMGLNGTKAQDKHWAAVDWKNNNIYVTWTQFDQYGNPNPDFYSNILFSKSTDGGMTWAAAKQINKVSGDCVDSDNTVEGAVPTVGPNGEIYVAWAGPEGLVFDRSLDQGETWLNDDIFISDIGGGWDYAIPGIYRANGLPITVCDTSGGPYTGNIYVNWTDQRNGFNDTDVWLAKSTDGGNTWSDPIRVNDDPPARQQFFTWMAIDQTNGYLYFVFYDRRNYSAQSTSTDVYMARSTDGGETFTNFLVSEEPFTPTPNVFFGDYTNLTVHNNVIRPIWARLNNNQMSIYTAIIDTAMVGTEELAGLTPFNIESSFPNPFRESTCISFKLHRQAPVSLAVYDQLGQPVEVILREKVLFPGKYTYQFDAQALNLSSGIYYFVLISNDRVERSKIIYNK
jgi:hypothetical protein